MNAFSGGTLISGPPLPDPSLPGIKATIDAMSGDGERFYDVNEDFRTLVDALGTGLVVTLTDELNPEQTPATPVATTTPTATTTPATTPATATSGGELVLSPRSHSVRQFAQNALNPD